MFKITVAMRIILVTIAAIGCVAIIVASQNRSGAVSMVIADENALVATRAGESKKIAITVANGSALRARIVGTNAC